MTTLVATDLDRTMIFSRKACRSGPDLGPLPELVEVERRDGAAASFMTATAAAHFTDLAASTILVPVTTRIPEQLARVTLPGPPRPFAIASNGGHLFVDGVLDREWSARVAASLAAGFPLDAVWEHVGHVCRPEFTRKVRNARDLFCYAVIRPEHLPSGFVDDVGGWAAERGWRISLQGRKLYWVPEVLTKSAAVAEVAARVGAGLVLAAGDSLLDVDLLLRADRGIHPRHGELFESGWSAPSVLQTQACGVMAGEEIVDWFAAQAHAAAS
jgi:hypothetical protein